VSAATSRIDESSAAYVYGVVRGGDMPSIEAEGVGGSVVRQVERDGLAALVSSVPKQGLRVKRRDLHRHLRVIEEAFAATTILPCPFGTVVASTESVEHDLLLSRRDELLSAVERLEGKVQMNVKATYAEPELLRQVVEGNPEIAHLRERTKQLGDAGYYDRLRLGELVAAALAGRRRQDAERLLPELAQSAAEVVADDEEAAVVKGSFLVSLRELGRFDATLEAVARREQPLIRFEVIGPLPPTAFASAYDEG
jgi:hypothetical protein